MIPDPVERPGLSQALADYSDRIFSSVPLREKYKHPLRYEFEAHLEEFSEELRDLGYKPYAVEEEVIRRMGPPDHVVETFNRMESLRNWFRDHLCTRAVAFVALGYAALSAAIELLNLFLGLSGLDMQIAYDFDMFMYDARPILALFTGPVAYWLYYRWSGNTHRLTPFATLSIGLFVVVTGLQCNLNFISPFPNPECRIFLVFDFPCLFSNIPLFARSYVVYEFGLSGFSIEILKDSFHVISRSYSPGAKEILINYSLGLALVAASFLLERVKQRQSLQLA